MSKHSQTPSRPRSPALPEPPPYRLPNSSDLAYLGRMPTPTVRQLVDPRQSSTGSATAGYAQDADASSTTDSRNQVLASAPADTASNSATTTKDRDPPSHDPRNSPSIFPPNAVLSSASRQWEGTTSDGVRVHRKDTWIIGQGWGRHMRVIEGLGPRRPASATMDCKPSGTNEARNRGFEGGEIKRHRSC